MNLFRKILLILLIAAVFVSVDLGINFAASLVPALQDGISARSVLQGLFGVFGDSGWTQKDFLFAFEKALWGAFLLLCVNLLPVLFSKKKK